MSECLQRRESDPWTYKIARPFTLAWDWIDKRQVDKHAVSLAILWGTWRLTEWAMAYAAVSSIAGKNGVETGAVIAAVTAPYMMLQAAAIAFYFKART
jgi:hypothetical protein